MIKSVKLILLAAFVAVSAQAQQTDGRFNLSNFWLETQKGSVIGHSVIVALGEYENGNRNVVTGEDVTRSEEVGGPGRLPTPSITGEQFTVVSTSAQDSAAGTGVRTVRLYIIRAADGAEYTEDVTLNGTTGVDTTITDGIFINDMHAIPTVGSNGVAEGNITVYKKGGTIANDLYQFLVAGGNKSLVPHRMVEAGYTLYLTTWQCTQAQASKRATYRIRSTDMHGVLMDGVFLFKDVLYLGGPDSSGSVDLFYTPIPEYSIVKVTHWSDADGTEGSCSYGGIKVRN